MKFIIKHETPGRMRVHLNQKKMDSKQADILLYYLSEYDFVTEAKAYEKTADASVSYRKEKRAELVQALKTFSFDNVEVPDQVLQTSGRELNNEYKEKLITHVIKHYAKRWFLPVPICSAVTVCNSLKFLKLGASCLAKGKLEVPVLDATAITVSMVRGDMSTAGSIMFLLGIGEILEEWTHKKSVNDLARSMSLNVKKVWLQTDEEQEILVDATEIQQDDHIIVHMGTVIPFDGLVIGGDGMVNQASLTGEAVPVRKTVGGYVYAGTVLEEGELIFEVKQTGGSTRYEKIVQMIEESEKLKSSLEGKAEHLADSLVPWMFGGTAVTYLLTRNATKALSMLMVDFSCALKLAMPISVLSAIREASNHNMTVKGGKFLEAMSEATTIVFDKTGTLTKAKPTVKMVVPTGRIREKELLRIAACLEEHFPHSMAKAVVEAAKEDDLVHEEMHSKVEYIVAHGIASSINGKRVVIGSSHFVFEDEKSMIREEYREIFDSISDEYSHLYLAVNGTLEGVICIEDPLRPESKDVIRGLKAAGFERIVMMTGDSDRTAKAVAERVGVDQYFSEVLPEDKANFIESEKAAGRKVVMIGDGINDSPALSAADVGIAISDGAELAREIADITVSADSLDEIVTLKLLSDRLIKRINTNYRTIVGFNSGLIILGLLSMITPATAASLHNMSTLLISLNSMRNLLE